MPLVKQMNNNSPAYHTTASPPYTPHLHHPTHHTFTILTLHTTPSLSSPHTPHLHYPHLHTTPSLSSPTPHLHYPHPTHHTFTILTLHTTPSLSSPTHHTFTILTYTPHLHYPHPTHHTFTILTLHTTPSLSSPTHHTFTILTYTPHLHYPHPTHHTFTILTYTPHTRFYLTLTGNSSLVLRTSKAFQPEAEIALKTQDSTTMTTSVFGTTHMRRVLSPAIAMDTPSYKGAQRTLQSKAANSGC